MVKEIQKIENGKVIKCAKYFKKRGGFYQCYEPGQTMNPICFRTLDETASFLRERPQRRIRMDPGNAMTSENIYIDGERL